jgi:sugar/nucleoside kinase (ribokinase family)
MAVDVVGFGENSIDYVYRLADWPMPGTATAKLPIAAHDVMPGGQVATTLATCAALGLGASYLGVFGDDANGGRMRRELAAAGVDVTRAIVHHAANRYAVILVDERQGERVVLWERDPRLDLAESELPRDLLQQTRLLHVDDVDEEGSIAAARIARDAGAIVTSDIDRVTPRTDALLQAVTIAMFAAHVPQQLTGEPDPERALRALRRRHDGWLCVTLGRNGSILLDGDRLHRAPAFDVDVVDTTGAGDVFRGAFIYATLRGDAPQEILRFANAAAAVSCTKRGAMGGVPTLSEVESVATKHTKTF